MTIMHGALLGKSLRAMPTIFGFSAAGSSVGRSVFLRCGHSGEFFRVSFFSLTDLWFA
jgi:hypothetical protein